MYSDKQQEKEFIVSIIMAESNDIDWHSDIVRYSETIINREFYCRQQYSSESKVIDTNKIVGTSHYSYQGCSWAEMLKYLKRLSINFKYNDITEIKAIILDETISEKKTVLKFGDDYYIDQGNHRLCIAKFLRLHSLLCDVIEYQFQQDDYNLYQELKSLGFTVGEYKNGYFFTVKYNDIFFGKLTMLQALLLLNAYKSCRTYSSVQMRIAVWRYKYDQMLKNGKRHSVDDWKFVRTPKMIPNKEEEVYEHFIKTLRNSLILSAFYSKLNVN